MLFKTCMSHLPKGIFKNAKELHKLLYFGDFEECFDIVHKNCGGELAFDYVAVGHFCSNCSMYDGDK